MWNNLVHAMPCHCMYALSIYIYDTTISIVIFAKRALYLSYSVYSVHCHIQILEIWNTLPSSTPPPTLPHHQDPPPFPSDTKTATSEVLPQGNAQYSWPPCTNEFRSAPLYIENSIYLFTKQATLMRRSTVLSLPPQSIFPAATYHAGRVSSNI